MNTKRKEELEYELKTITSILIKARESFLIVQYLYKPEEDEKVSYVKGRTTFLGYSKFMYWQILIIELAKLFYFNAKNKADTGRRERFNLRHLIKKLNKRGQFSEANVSEFKINEWLTKLDNEDDNITNLLKQRDKLYAHEDGEKIENILSIENVNRILLIAIKIVKEINLSVFKRGINFSPIPSPSDSLKYIVEKLAKNKT